MFFDNKKVSVSFGMRSTHVYDSSTPRLSLLRYSVRIIMSYVPNRKWMQLYHE